MAYQWQCSPSRQIELLMENSRLADYEGEPRLPWNRHEPQPQDLTQFEEADGEIAVPMVDADGDEVARMWVAFVENPNPDDDPCVAELRGWRLNPEYC